MRPACWGIDTGLVRKVARPREPRDAPDRRRAGVWFGLLSLAGTAALFAAVQANRTTAFDLTLTLRIQGRRSQALGRVMTAVSTPGFPPQSRIIPPAIVAFLWLRHHRLEAVIQAVAWGTAGLSTLVKQVTERPRPLSSDVNVVVATLGGSSFPSGHVLTYVGVYGYAAYLANSMVRPRWLRTLAVGPLIGLIILIGPSRIYLGHHWPTDVLASYLLGIASLLGITALYGRLKRRETFA
jgi:undecaprenyl-diphosphatase